MDLCSASADYAFRKAWGLSNRLLRKKPEPATVGGRYVSQTQGKMRPSAWARRSSVRINLSDAPTTTERGRRSKANCWGVGLLQPCHHRLPQRGSVRQG